MEDEDDETTEEEETDDDDDNDEIRTETTNGTATTQTTRTVSTGVATMVAATCGTGLATMVCATFFTRALCIQTSVLSDQCKNGCLPWQCIRYRGVSGNSRFRDRGSIGIRYRGSSHSSVVVSWLCSALAFLPDCGSIAVRQSK